MDFRTINLKLKPVCNENRKEVLRLQVLPEQKGFIETVEQCLGEAAQNKRWRPFGVYDGHLLVGFAMYGYFFWEYLPDGRLWMDRLLIDARYQGKGYGKAALNCLLNRLALNYPKKRIHLSVYKENTHAIRLYESFGFRFTGERDAKGEAVMVK